MTNMIVPFICVTVTQLASGDIDVALGRPVRHIPYELIDYASVKIYWRVFPMSGMEYAMIWYLIKAILAREGITMDTNIETVSLLPKSTLQDEIFKTAIVIAPAAAEYGMQVQYAGVEDGLADRVYCRLPDGQVDFFFPSELYVVE